MKKTEWIDQGIDAGFITAEQRAALLEPVALSGACESVPLQAGTESEPFRLVSGANDVLVGLGIVLLLSGLLSVLLAYFGVQSRWTYFTVAAMSLALAEFITRRRKLKFSSFVLALWFAAAIAAILGMLIFEFFVNREIENLFQLIAERENARLIGWASIAFMCAVTALHLARYRVPVMSAIIALAFASLCSLMLADFLFGEVLAVNIQLGDTEQMKGLARKLLYFPLVIGILLFAAGFAMDVKDRNRETLWSDCAFWMHVVSAPLMVHPLFVLATGRDIFSGSETASGSATGLVLLFIAVFLYLALIIDRRSLLVPSLAYFGSVGIAEIISQTAETTGLSPVALVLLVLGSLIILFGIGWHKIRGLVVRTTLPHLLANRLPTIQP